MSTLTHGTLNGYVKHKCRCDECKAVKAASAKRWRDENPASDGIRSHNAEYQQTYYREHAAERAAYQAEYRASERGAAVRANSRHKRRAQMQGVDSEQIIRNEVYERDGYICGLCGQPIDPFLKHPDRMSASLDHLIPLSKGGTHTLANVQAAHFSCNSRKGNRV